MESTHTEPHSLSKAYALGSPSSMESGMQPTLSLELEPLMGVTSRAAR